MTSEEVRRRDTPMGATSLSIDEFSARLNYDETRSQQALSTWFSEMQARNQSNVVDEDIDDDFDVNLWNEHEGLGSKPKPGGEGKDESIIWRAKKASSTDRLLEQLLGSKGAKAKKKQLAASNHKTTSKPLPAKITDTPSKRLEEDSEDEGGRVAAFTSKRPLFRKSGNLTTETLEALQEDVDNQDTRSAVVVSKSLADEEEPKPVKRKTANGYLDELLSANASKRKKKKKKNNLTSDAAP